MSKVTEEAETTLTKAAQQYIGPNDIDRRFLLELARAVCLEIAALRLTMKTEIADAARRMRNYAQ